MSEETVEYGNDIMDLIGEDLKRRNCAVVGFIVRSNDSNRLRVISYDDTGSVVFISDEVEQINMSEQLSGSMVRPLGKVGNRQESTRKDEMAKRTYLSPEWGGGSPKDSFWTRLNPFRRG